MIKNLNWIEEFKRTQEIKASNRKFLRENKLIPICKSFVYDINNLNIKLDDLDKKFFKLYLKLVKLNSLISHQKGRITRQTREQNKEKDETNIAFSELREDIEFIKDRISFIMRN